MTMQTRAQVELAREVLARKFEAKQVILFGSQANGDAVQESDIDLCVITALKDKRKIELTREIRRELLDLITSPLDILVYGEEEFLERAKLSNTLEHKIMRDGIRIHGQ
ncbi:MAG: nucleotidyltransferase domain-containing protein [candidate division KSB1 bacterium]